MRLCKGANPFGRENPRLHQPAVRVSLSNSLPPPPPSRLHRPLRSCSRHHHFVRVLDFPILPIHNHGEPRHDALHIGEEESSILHSRLSTAPIGGGISWPVFHYQTWL